LKKYFARNSPNLAEIKNVHSQEAEQTLHMINPKKSMPTHHIIKLLIVDRLKTWRATRTNQNILYRGKVI
jgi:hypothetical protein